MFESRRPDTSLDALARLDDLVAQGGALSDSVADCDGWASSQRTGALRRLDRLAGVLATVRSRLLVAEQRVVGAEPGDRDFAATRARVTRTGLGEARREVRQAEALDALPTVADAVASGRMPVAHLDALARARASAGPDASAALERPDVQGTLVRWSERLPLTEFAASAARLVASFDPAALERSADAQRRERFLHLSHQADGTFLKGRLDRVSGAALRLALDAVQQAPDDDRTKAQADADALVMLAERATSGAAGVRARRQAGDGRLAADPEQDTADARVSGVAARPTLSLLVPAETFAEVRGAQQRADATGERRWHPVEPATLEDGTPVAMSELARLLCDCEIGRVVLDAASQPLDVGRTTRLFTAAQRRAIIIRDRACAWNGCDVPAAYCEAHHIRWWDRDLGDTSVENGLLLCSHHHHVVHRLDLAITRLARPARAPARHGPLVAEPTRYAFRSRDGRAVNAPPAGWQHDEPPPEGARLDTLGDVA